jgi:cytochrome c556
MADQASDAQAHLERAADMVWEAIQRLEEAQRILFKAGDAYVAQVYGDGVRAVIEVTEDMADAVGDLTQCHIEIGKIGKRDKGRGWKDS